MPTIRPKMSAEDKLALVPEIVKKLQSGTKFAEIRRDPNYPSSGLRRALALSGYDTRGEACEAIKRDSKPVSDKVLARRVAARRAAGVAWWRIGAETGKPVRELKKLLADNGPGAA